MQNEHQHGHDHNHGHSHHNHPHHRHAQTAPLLHGHGHGLPSQGLVFGLAFGLNFIFVLVEIAYGLIGHSMALLADAGHNFGDMMGLAAAWGAYRLGQILPTGRFTYGLGGSSILAALLNSIILLIAVGAISVEAVQLLIAPQPVSGTTMIWVAALGVAINGLTALVLLRGQHQDLNVTSAMAHALGDAGVSLGVAVAGALILVTGWLWLDPAMSLLVSAVIVAGTWKLMRRALDMALDAVPHGIDPRDVRAHLTKLDGVAAVHDLHIWPMSTTETALTAHLVMPKGHPGDAALAHFAAGLDERFAIGHATFQVETGAQECALEPDHVV